MWKDTSCDNDTDWKLCNCAFLLLDNFQAAEKDLK